MEHEPKTVYDRVVAVLDEYTGRLDGANSSSELVVDLGMDSLDLIAVRAALEGEFDVHIPDDAMSELITVGELSEFIAGRLQAAGAVANTNANA